MGEIGAGTGTSYPGAIDTDSTLEVDGASGTDVRAATPNDQNAAIIAIEGTLGVNPQGSKATVVERLDVDHGTDGTHDNTKVGLLAGAQLFTGAKTFSKLNYDTDSGGTDAYAVTVNTSLTSYTDGLMIIFKANTANTGVCTLDVNSINPITIKKNKSQDLSDGDIKAGQIITVVYDSTDGVFQMQTESGSAEVQVSADDTTVGVLNGKLTGGVGITFKENNGGGNETLDIISDHGMEVFTSSGTWTQPNSNVTTLKVISIGAGGGGGASNTGGTESGGGGGGGEYTEAVVTVSGNITVTIGAGGAGGSTGGGNGSVGGDTTFGALTTAKGGAAGSGGSGGAGAGGAGGTGGSITGNRMVIENGIAGSAGNGGTVGGNGGAKGWAGAQAVGGAGVNGGVGTTGTEYGDGGGGAGASNPFSAGGAGAAGAVIVIW